MNVMMLLTPHSLKKGISEIVAILKEVNFPVLGLVYTEKIDSNNTPE